MSSNKILAADVQYGNASISPSTRYCVSALVSETSARFGLAWDEIIVPDGQSAPHTSLLQTDLNTVQYVCLRQKPLLTFSTLLGIHKPWTWEQLEALLVYIYYWLDFQTWGTHWCLIRAVIRNTPNSNAVRHKVSCAIVSPTRKQHYFCFWSISGIRPVQAKGGRR